MVAALLAAWLGAAPAHGHDQLISSVPGEGETLTALPATIMLEFSNELIPAAPALLLRDASGATVYRATPAVQGRVATAPFPELPDGDYRINWSVVSSDGHRIEGSMPFTLATGRPAAGPTAGDGDAAGVTGQPADGVVAASPSRTGEPAGGGVLSDLPAAARIAIGVGALGAAAVAVAVLQRARRGGLRGQ